MATLTKLCNHVGLGDIAFKRDYIFTICPTFSIKGGSYDVMPSFQCLLFKLNEDVVNRTDAILTWVP